MVKSEIRVQYSGFVIFGAKLLSVATGMIFTLLITRNATKEQYGVWANIFDLMGYFTLLAGIIPFWTFRFAARKKKGAIKTGFYANLVIAIISVALYLPLVPFITLALNISQSYIVLYVVASLQIIELYLLNVLEGCLRAEKPHAVGYGLLIEEVCKIIIAYILIVEFRQPLLGAMISLVTAISIQVIYYIKLVSPDFKQKIQWNYIREWLKGSTVNIYYTVGSQIAASIYILLFIYGGQAARGDYQAATIIANIVVYSSYISFALYPKMLAENSLKDITTSLRMVLMFAIPMAAGAMAMPDSFVTILDETYREAWPILLLLAIDAIVVTISQFYSSVLFGVERLDEEAKIPLKQLAKSHIFKVFTLPYIQSAITLPTAFFVLSSFAVNQPVQAAVYVATITMAAHFAMFFALYVIMRKSVSVIVPWRNIAKFVFASAVMATILYILPHPTKLAQTLATATAGGILYLTLLILIDKDARTLAISIWREIKSKVAELRMHLNKLRAHQPASNKKWPTT